MKTLIRKGILIIGLVASLAGLAGSASATVLDDENRLTVVLDSGLQVHLIGEATSIPGTKSSRYYYLPTNLRLSSQADGTPQFLFLKYITEARGGPSGGLVHFLMEYGLTREQEAELTTKLKRQEAAAELVGAVPMLPDGETGSFQIISATLSDKTLTPSVVTSGNAPLLTGDKVAAAARLSAEGAQLLDATLQKTRSIADLSIEVKLKYATLAPAARGYIEMDWSKLQKESESLKADYSRKQTGTTKTTDCFIFCYTTERPEYSQSYEEIKSEFGFLEEKGILKVHLDQTGAMPEERMAKIRDAFYQVLLSSIARPTEREDAPPPARRQEEGKNQTPDTRQGAGYKINQSAIKSRFESKTQRIEFNERMMLVTQHKLVGNLATWYNTARDNPKCVGSVNLNDPFFQHRDIHFILDGDAKDMFEEAVNYVTVNVRKRRSEGRPFEDHVTIDAKHLKDKGVDSVVTYARGEDRDPDTYEYQAQWGLRGGRVYPQSPTWQKGNWEGQTLALPVAPRTIQVEGDIEAMKSSDITRITVQIHYQKFGEEMEENISVSPIENKPLVDKRIFMDRNTRGFAYRLILYHKTEGRLALSWVPQSDNYVYASIPPDLLKTPTLKDAAKEAAKTIVNSAKEKVLERFTELVGEKKP